MKTLYILDYDELTIFKKKKKKKIKGVIKIKTLIVIDMQKDFVEGVLGTPEAKMIVPRIKKKIEQYIKCGDNIIFTKDVHYDNYLNTNEGKHLPIPHCIYNTKGGEIVDELNYLNNSYKNIITVSKTNFGFNRWQEMLDYFKITGSFELVGVCTDICVVTNALILKTLHPEADIIVDELCCAGTTPENHRAAIQIMKSCQIDIVGENND